ncbi:MAG: hypothetical protein WC570_05430 [Patescibacteria group bacterium]
MKTKQLIDEIIGWYGAIAIVGAFAMVSFEFWAPTSFFYQFFNATGGLGMIYISFIKRAYQPAVLNLFWSIIAIVAIVRLFV